MPATAQKPLHQTTAVKKITGEKTVKMSEKRNDCEVSGECTATASSCGCFVCRLPLPRSPVRRKERGREREREREIVSLQEEISGKAKSACVA